MGGKGRQVGGDHDRGHVAGADLLAANIDTEPFQHCLQRLLGEGRIVEGVAGTVEADNKAVADHWFCLPQPSILARSLMRDIAAAVLRCKQEQRREHSQECNQESPGRRVLIVPCISCSPKSPDSGFECQERATGPLAAH